MWAFVVIPPPSMCFFFFTQHLLTAICLLDTACRLLWLNQYFNPDFSGKMTVFILCFLMSVGLSGEKAKCKPNHYLPGTCAWRIHCMFSKKFSCFEYPCHAPQEVLVCITDTRNPAYFTQHLSAFVACPCKYHSPVSSVYLETFRICLSSPERTLSEEDADLSDPPQWPNSSSNQCGKIPDRQYPGRHMGNVEAAESRRPVRRGGDRARMLTCCLASFLTLTVITYWVSF